MNLIIEVLKLWTQTRKWVDLTLIFKGYYIFILLFKETLIIFII